MSIRRFLFPSLLGCAVLALTLRLFAEPASAKPVFDSGSYEEMDAYIERQLDALNIPGASLAIIEGDEIVHVKGFGETGPGGETPTPQTPFVICSLTKSFTALAVMQLVDAGKIDLDAPVQRYLPWFTLADPQAAALAPERSAGASVTVRHLLYQTSGLSFASGSTVLANWDDSPDATQKQARELATFKPTRPVGSAFEYSNVNYNLLGLVIEAASGETYPEYIQNHIFDPLDMKHSYTSKAAAKQDGLAVGHMSWFGFPVAVPDLPQPRGSLASGQLIASTEDMAHYLMAQLNGGRYGEVQILSPEGVAEMHSPAVDATTTGVDLGYYGMGWFVQQTDQGVSLWHDGTGPDYYSYMVLLPDQHRGLVLLFNTNEFMINFALKFVGGGAASLLAGVQPEYIPWAVVPWSLRAFLIIPALQALGIFLTLMAVRRWRQDENRRPGSVRKWLQVVLPAIPNLALVFCALWLLTSGMFRFWLFFMADLTWLALICGSIALVWIVVRTTLILRTLREPQASKALIGRPGTEQ